MIMTFYNFRTIILILTTLGFMNQEKLIEVNTQEPINPVDIKIDIVLLGWQTLKYNIYSGGVSSPENIPDSTNLYVLKLSYQDTLFYSQPYHNDNNILNNKVIMEFDFFQKADTTYCKLISPSYTDLNGIVALRDFETDFKELMKFYEGKIKEE